MLKAKTVHLTLCIAVLLSLSACSWFKKSNHVEKNVTTIPVARQVYLDTRHLFPLTLQGDYWQKINTSVKDKQHSLSVYLTLHPDQLQATAFNDIAGRLYQLTWQADRINWHASHHMPSILKPRPILADFLLANLSMTQLKNALHGASVYEKTMGQKKIRIITSQYAILRSITYYKPLGSLWQHIVIDNPALDYKLDIQTVVAP